MMVKPEMTNIEQGVHRNGNPLLFTRNHISFCLSIDFDYSGYQESHFHFIINLWFQASLALAEPDWGISMMLMCPPAVDTVMHHTVGAAAPVDKMTISPGVPATECKHLLSDSFGDAPMIRSAHSNIITTLNSSCVKVMFSICS